MRGARFILPNEFGQEVSPAFYRRAVASHPDPVAAARVGDVTAEAPLCRERWGQH